MLQNNLFRENEHTIEFNNLFWLWKGLVLLSKLLSSSQLWKIFESGNGSKINDKKIFLLKILYHKIEGWWRYFLKKIEKLMSFVIPK